MAVQPMAGNKAQVSLLINRAVVLCHSGNNEEAVTLLKQAVAINPNNLVAHIDLAASLAGLRRYDESMQEAQIAIQIDPSDQRPYMNYVSSAIMSHHLEEALKVGRAYLKKFPHGTNKEQIKNALASVENQMKITAKTGGLAGPTGCGDNYLYLATPRGVERWGPGAFPLKVFIYRPDNCKGFMPVFNTALTEAFKNWQKSSANLVSFIPATDPREADIECKWTDDPSELRSPGEGGETQTACRSTDGRLAHASITLLTWVNGKGVSPTLIWATSLHEIGHALGLAGHSDNPQDILYAWMTTNVEHAQLSARDVNTLRLLYQSPPLGYPALTTQQPW